MKTLFLNAPVPVLAGTGAAVSAGYHAGRQARLAAGALVRVLRGGVLLLGVLAGPLARAQSGGGADVYVPGGRATALNPPKAGAPAAKILAAPQAFARTSQILLNTYGDTPLAVPLAAEANSGNSITLYFVTVLPPPASGVLRFRGAVVTTSTVINAVDAGLLTFDPAPGYFDTAVFQYVARDNNNGANNTSLPVTYGIPVSKAACGAGVGQANQLSYYARTEGEDWKVTRSVVVDGVTVTANPTTPVAAPYVSSPATSNFLFISDQLAIPGKGLVWSEDYTSSAAATSAVTLTFSRPLANFSLSVSDIDIGTGYIDQLTLQGYDAAGNLVSIPNANVTTSAANTYSANVFTGTANSNTTAAHNVMAVFPAPISRLVMTYRNTTTQADPSSQLIGFASIAWCAQADLQTTLTGPSRAQAGSTVSYTATVLNVSGDQVSSVTPTVQLPTGLSNVTGGSYNSTTGLLTLATISNLAAGASVATTVTYTMPATVAVMATSGLTSTADDPTPGNNAATLITAQNRAPVANAVTHAPAILSSATNPTNLASFNASDPDASPGNTTIVSYTITALPTAAAGTLFVSVGGAAPAAATLNQVINVPVSATPAAPGYQLSFVPNGTFAGNAAFTYKATDDAGSNSNTATYTVPVTAGADVMSTAGGSTTGVEGQTKSYSVTTTNNGPATATNVVPTLTLAHKPAFSSVTVTNGSYDPTTGVVTFNPTASLASGALIISSVVLLVQATPATLLLTAASTSATADPTPANNNGSAAAANLTVVVAPVGPAGLVAGCATPGKDGSPVLTARPNAYYRAGAATQTVLVGALSISVGPAIGAATDITAGDLLLVIQMQGADIDFSNTSAYGDGVAGGFAAGNLNNANFTAGQYEYVTVASGASMVAAASGGTVQLATALVHSYQNADATASTGQRRFQVVRIPQYLNLTVSGTVVPTAWDGNAGGILAVDVTGKVSFATGARFDASGMGFRGGAGQRLTGTTGRTGTDYRAGAPATGTTLTGAHAMKGEGVVGTPRYVRATNATALVDTGVDGYPSGSAGRGGAGNAGGGGTDASPTGNDQNSGGGGGSNGARGGRGGNSWTSNQSVGGDFGAAFNPPSTSRLVMGGGGGAGSSNNGTGDAGLTGFASSGAAGGGIVLVRAGSVAGTGMLVANGASAGNDVGEDGSGGGGGGGSILLTANNAASLGILNLAANGGSGGTNTGNGLGAHGPGGGGGGGIILTNGTTNMAAVAGGSGGTTAGGAAYGAWPGLSGLANQQISNQIANSTAGISCSADVTAALTAPDQATTGQTVSGTALFANNGGMDASSVTRTVTLASGSSSNPFTTVDAPGGVVSGLNTANVTITYPALATLAAGSSSQFNFSYTAPGTLAIGTTASVTTTTSEPVTTNNSSTVSTSITGFADIVAVIFGLGTSTAGRPSATYGALFANNGPAAATNVTRRVTLPVGATLTPAQLSTLTTQGATYDSGTRVLDFGTLATLNSRDVSVYRIAYTASNTGGNGAIVTKTTTDTPQGTAVGSTGAVTAPDDFSFAVTNNSAADVSTNGITPSAASVVAGQSASFTLNFINYGPGDALNAIRAAHLNPGLTVASITGGGVYDAATGNVTYPTIASLAVGAGAPSTITFAAPAIGPVGITGNMGTGVGIIGSGNFDNNEATASLNVTPLADVATTLLGPASAVTGNLVTFAVTTANQGPSPAADVVQTVQLPAGLSAAGVFASSNGVYNTATGVVTFPKVDVLANGAKLNNTVSFAMTAAGFTATAAVSTATGEAGATANNSATTTAAAAAATGEQANVYTELTFSNKNVAPGAPVTYTVVTGNHGPGTATAVGQQVALPPSLSVGSISGGGTYDAATGLVTFPALASQASGTSVANTIELTAPVIGPLVAVASVSSAAPDPVPANNVTVRNVDIMLVTDLSTTVLGPAMAAATQVAVFIVQTANNGPVPATNAVQTVAIPAGFAPGEVTATGGGMYNPATGVITWPAVALLAVGETKTYSYSYVTPAYKSTDAAFPRTIVSQAAVTSTTPDGLVANNTAAVGTRVKWNANVAVAIAGPEAGIVGNPVVFTVSTTNNGPAPATTVNTTVRIATGLNVVASGGGVYDIMTGIVTFPPISEQPTGVTGIVTNTITVIAPDRPLIGASAAADIPAITNDINLTNNAMTILLPLTPPTTALVDFQATVVANRASQEAGQPVVLTVTATNANANGTAANLRGQLSLPAGLAGVEVRGSNGTLLTGAYDAATGAVTFPTATGVAANTTLTYTVTVNNPSNDPLVATASINGNFSDPALANNSQVVSVTIVPVADVATLVSGPATLLPGAQASYEVVTVNNGPSPASSVHQAVQLPTGLTGVVLSGGGSYDAASGVVTFPTIARQAVGKSGSVANTIRFVFPTTTSVLTATVTAATGAGSTPNTANNSATLTTTLTNQLPLANTIFNRLQTPQGNTADPLVLSALNGFDPDGTLASFAITTLPEAAAGVLSLNGTAVTAGQVISLADEARLRFDPLASFVGNVFFTYTATDNQGATSAPALFAITVGQDNGSVYTSTPLRGGTNQYQNGDVVANAFDANGGAYNAAAAVTDNGVRTARLSGGTLPDGTELDPATGQVRVFNRSLLVAGTYPVSIRTVDANGGVTTQAVSLRIGDFPLPVVLTRFEATAADADARLGWSTAQEMNNAGFAVERSFDGTRFERLGFVAGAGTSAQTRHYAYLDAGVGRQHVGPVYYRLQQRDTDGKPTYSPVRTVAFAPAALTLYPNPAAQHTTLDLSGLPAAPCTVQVVDGTGRTVLARELTGGLAHLLEIGHLHSGAYLVMVRSGHQQFIRRLLKQ